VLDITNPEAPPVLLGEYTMLEDAPYRTDLGFTTPSPTPVVMKDDATTNEWYLLMGSGPTAETASDGIGTLPIFDAKTAIKGYSGQKPKVAVFPLKWLTTDKHSFRVPDAAPTAMTPSGVFTLNGSNNGFVSDMITVDYDLNANYKSDAVYFGTVEHGTASVASAEAGTASYDDVWDGQLYRVRMRELDANGDQKATPPDSWSVTSLFNARQPITAAPSVGTDYYNYWIYFGTGRFFDALDKADDAQQSYYGIKELTDCTGRFTWPSFNDNTGLVDVSQILVKQGGSVDSAQLYCLATRGDLSTGNITDQTCLPSNASGTIENLGSLITYIAGSGTTAGSSCVDTTGDGVVDTLTGKDGWYRDFPKITRPRERNVGQATLLGGLLTFTTYQPYDDPCQQEGLAYLYGLYYQTGTAWYKTVFGAYGLEGDRVLESIGLGRGLATTPNLHVGSEDGTTAFIQTSTGEILEIEQEPPIENSKSGRQSWRER
jgi:type IV pilus assembly protein PilY1